MQIGICQTLSIKRFSPHGAYLIDEHQQEVLLPKKFVTQDFKIHDKIQVFISTDSNDRIVATTQIPYAQCNQIAILQIKSIEPWGCFLDMGLDKDLFMPTKNPSRFHEKQKVCVFITLDKQNRMIAKLGIKEHLLPLKQNKRYYKMQAFIFEKTPLGFGCVVDHQYYGILYHDELKTSLEFFKPYDVMIKKVRLDGKLDLMLDSSYLIAKLKRQLKQEGFLDFNYNSHPKDIEKAFGISKKLFKKTISALIAKNHATIKNNQIVNNKN